MATTHKRTPRKRLPRIRRSQLSQRLKDLREGRGLSFEDLAEAIGISKTYLWGMESGKFSNPSTKVCNKLASFYDVPVTTLFDGTVRAANAEEVITWEDLGVRARGLTQGQLRLVAAVVDGLLEAHANANAP